MAKTNTGYSQGHRINPLTVPTPYHEGESMTSWLVRASLNQGCDPLTFTQYYWPDYRLWTQDVDRGFSQVNSDIQHDIEIMARIDTEVDVPATLIIFADNLGAEIKTQAAPIAWTQPLSKRNRTSQIGYPHCPECLEVGKNAYLKLSWRYSWVMYCTEHYLKLQSQCIYCDQPYQPQMLQAQARYLNRCHYCEQKLAVAAVSEIVHLLAYNFQQWAEQVWNVRQGWILEQQVSAGEWFNLVLFYVRLIRRAIKRPNHMFGLLLTYFGFKLDDEILETGATGLALDLLSIDDRVELFKRVYHLLEISPEQWLDGCAECGVSQNSFKWHKEFQVPAAFMPVFLQLPQKTKRSPQKQIQTINPKSSEAVKQSWARLQRKIKIREFYEQNLIRK
ncbi:TniQ family protein [Acinetobacter sp. ANC 3926]|nr:TniQ family protein [Acinetobacter genomosp. 15BJ]MCH7292578.1 TniQ family protein [Acinetobacter genomosp. 15BJ]